MSDDDDRFEDTLEGPDFTEELHRDKQQDLGIEKEFMQFSEESTKEEVLREAQQTEEDMNKKMCDEFEDDGHDRSIEEATKAKAEGNEYV